VGPGGHDKKDELQQELLIRQENAYQGEEGERKSRSFEKNPGRTNSRFEKNCKMASPFDGKGACHNPEDSGRKRGIGGTYLRENCKAVVIGTLT